MANFPNYMKGAYQQPYTNQYYPQQYAPMQQQGMISGRVVTSPEEAQGSPVDLVSGVSVFPCLNSDVVYVKVLDRNTGTAPLMTYRKEGVQQTRDDRLDRMQAQLDAILQMLTASPKGKHAQKEVSENV